VIRNSPDIPTTKRGERLLIECGDALLNGVLELVSSLLESALALLL